MVKIFFKDKEKYKDKIGIYGIKNIINNNIYIGKTSRSFLSRYKSHNYFLSNNKHFNMHLQNAWNKYGEKNFVFYAIDVVKDKKYLNFLERYYIKYYRKKNCCYNISSGGNGTSHPMSDHAKKLIGEKNRQHMLGRKFSEDTKRKMSEARKGKYHKRGTDVLNEEIARKIKIKLMNSEKPSNIASSLNIDYRSVNNILSNNTWSHVKVDGWDEWRKSRKIWTRLKKEDHEKIYDLYISQGYNKHELAEMYNKGVKMIEKILRDQRKLHGNPVAS